VAALLNPLIVINQMMTIENQTLALAGIFQSAALIEQLATGGELNQAAFDCSFDSLFTFNAPTAMDVFGNLSGLTRGLKVLSLYLNSENQDPGKDVAYYVLSMLKLASRLKSDEKLAAEIQSKLQKVESQSRDFELSRHSVVNQIDGVYQSTLSTIKPRVMVQGEQAYLRNPDTAGKIRTLLLAGIRAAVLWQQLGGSKWKLVFFRKKYVNTASQLLQKV
jgi:high frequency lysogenization protein